ncbi:MAG TPA: amino acid adenylation domain-containing protein [Allosphingosinicella sp.]
MDGVQDVAPKPLVGRPKLRKHELEALVELAAGDENCVDIFPLSPLQQGFMFHHLLDQGSYVVSAIWDVSGPLNATAFERAWHDLVAEHEPLRTMFAGTDLEVPLQLVQRNAALAIVWHDWRSLAEDDRARSFAELIEADRRAGFDLAEAPLMRVHVATWEDDRHRVLWNFHHILFDGWSTPILLRDLMRHYKARREDEVARPGKAPPFRDYVAWLQRLDTGASEAYWRNSFEGFFEDGVAAPKAGHAAEAGRDQAELAIALSITPDRLRAAAREARVTPGAVIHAAFASYLASKSESGKAIFGTTISARPAELPDVGERVGLYANLLPVLADPRPFRTAGDWLRGMQDQLLALTEHQHCPLPAIHQWSGLPADSQLFDATISIENLPPPSDEAAELADQLGFGPTTLIEKPHYPLNLLFRMRSAVELTFVYDPSRHDAAEIRRIGHELDALLSALADNIRDAPEALLTIADAKAPMPRPEWNETARAFPPQLIQDLIDRRAEALPDGVAAECGGETLTYDALRTRSNRLAHYLAGRGVGPDAIVPVLLERSLDLIVTMVAILKAGGAYLPLSTDDPPARLRAILRETGARLAIGRREAWGAIEGEAGFACVDIDEAVAAAAACPSARPPAALDPANLAYVLFTSGTTGGPKGVLVAHEALSNLIQAEAESAAFSAGDRVLQFKPVNFDASMFEMFATLAAGGTLVLASLTDKGAERDLGELLDEREISVLVCSPQMLATLAGRMPPKLRMAVVGGDLLTADIARGAAGIRLFNQYGPTETTVCATETEIGDPDLVSIGRPLPNVQTYIVDADYRQVPVGRPGALYVAGAGLARCYLNNPALTAERFVPNPWGPAGSRFYRTGDFARWREDGEIEFLHRDSDQVKIRGFRVGLGEIEEALAHDPDVERAVVAIRQDMKGEKYLAAYVIAAGGELDEAAIRERLLTHLPRYMVPRAFVALERFPLTPNGKIDQQALPEPELAKADDAIRPRSTAEQLIARIWSSVLGVEEVRRNDNFFDIGGHSLLAMRMMARVRKQLGVDLPLVTVFENPVLGELAREVEAAMRRETGAVSAPILPRTSSEPPPMSFGQERLWFLDQLGFGAAYNLPITLEIEGRLDVEALSAALSEIVRRHESLRTGFQRAEGNGLQIIEPPAPLRLKFVDLRGGDPSEIEADLRELRLAESRRPFDLTAAPLVRASLWRTDDERHVLLVMIHHIVSDGWSAEQLVKELLALYEDAQAGRAFGLPDLPIQYADYAIWQRGEAYQASSDIQLSYWKETLAGAPPAIDLPTDSPRPISSSFGGALEPLPVPDELLARLRTIASREDVTLFMVVMAAFDVLLQRWSCQSDIVVGTPIAGRTRVELEPLIGLLANTLPVRVRLDDDPSFRTLLQRVKDAALGAYVHEDARLEKIIEMLDVNRDLTRQPLFQVTIASQTVTDDEFEAAGARFRRKFDVELVRAKFDLTLHVFEAPSALTMAVEYSTDLFTQATAAEMASQLLELLDGLTARPNLPIRAAARAPASPVAQHLSAPTAMVSPDPGPALLDRFAALVEGRPDALAVTGDAGGLSYAELDRASDRLARELVELGVGPEVLIALHLDASDALATAMLGILKSGGGVLPIDHRLRADRVGHMLEMSGAPIILTNAALEQLLPIHFSQVVLIEDVPAGTSDQALPPRPDQASLAWARFTGDIHEGPRIAALSYRALSAAVSAPSAPDAHGCRALGLLAGILRDGEDAEAPPPPPHSVVAAELIEAAVLLQRQGLDGQDGPVRILVLDRWLEPTATGVPGELYLGGSSLARGYLGDPKATAERFVPAPGDGQRLLRTGLRARFRPGGGLQILGRSSRRIELAGLPIDLDMIESALRSHPSLADALVLPRPGDTGGEVLTAYVVAEEGAEAASAIALKDYLAGRVTLEETPAVFIIVEALPFLADGLVDADALPAPDGSSQVEPPFEAPSTQAEREVAEIWNELLERPETSIHSNFFQVGGESLKATLLMTRITQRLGAEIRLSKFFETPTIKAVAGHVESSRSGAAKPALGREAVIEDFI